MGRARYVVLLRASHVPQICVPSRVVLVSGPEGTVGRRVVVPVVSRGGGRARGEREASADSQAVTAEVDHDRQSCRPPPSVRVAWWPPVASASSWACPGRSSWWCLGAVVVVVVEVLAPRTGDDAVHRPEEQLGGLAHDLQDLQCRFWPRAARSRCRCPGRVTLELDTPMPLTAG